MAVRYGVDPELTKQLLMQSVLSVTNVLKSPAPIIRLEEFGVSGYVFLVRGFISTEMTLEQWNIASDVRFAIVKTLHEHNIELAYPVRVVRMATDVHTMQYLPEQDSGEKHSV